MTQFTQEDFQMAAKAAGLKVKTWEGHTGVMCAIDDSRHGVMWMPNRDNGDALQLAVKLAITVSHDSHYQSEDVFTRVGCVFGDTLYADQEPHGDDPCAATRLAIFRIAIAIGRDMP